MSAGAASPGVLDLAWMRRHVPIVDVAKKLDLTVIGNMVRCWRPENHQHDDRTPSVGLDSRRNKARCFVCDDRQLSNIDLVMSVNGCDMHAAVLWLAQRFEVQTLPKGSHLKTNERWRPNYRAGIRDDGLNFLIKSGVYAELRPAAKSVVSVMMAFSEDDKCVISYRGLMRYAGLGSDASVRAAIKQLEALHIIKRGASPATHCVLRAVARYELTLDDARVLALADDTYHHNQHEIQLERELRREARRVRRCERNDKNDASLSEEIQNPGGRPLSGVIITGIELSSLSEVRNKFTLQKVKRQFVQPDKNATLRREKRHL